ncbi:ThuA domain-containing protein [Noviherbaspirillum sedimenti]|uniref:ThuA-like domain-containing protein n=1 Tax=Noviherbaspirillum sedimenti TaxID=2320865 RepID=A0A3A3G619_9BURK|nr:ThuA domain-containing protein [Noviherbaspirillum sedimenti]RJG03381.1 hypothetical protein D3878_18745 [Noviherbaspirillum sedimenti]
MDNDLPEYHRGRSGRGGQTFFPAAGTKKNILLVTRGHAFVRDEFYAIFEENPEIEWSGVEHPAAQLMFTPETARHFDCYVLYDMPGIEFKRSGDGVPTFHAPPQHYKDGLLAMLDAGLPLVILHHACAAWPTWPEWAEIVGAQFLYQPMKSRGVDKPDSGYRIDVSHTVSPVLEHPITEGVAPFELTDELYLFEVFEESVIPLFRSDFSFTSEHFYSAKQALAGTLNVNAGWQHAPGSNLVGWVKRYRNSPIVYLQFGDGPVTYRNPSFRKILQNAIRWACSPEALRWARQSDAAGEAGKD